MYKLIVLLSASIILTSCSKDYTGEYEHAFKTKKTYYVNTKTGKETTHIDPLLSFISRKETRPQYKKIIKEIDSKMVLSLKQEKTKITGNMNVSNEFNVTKFNIASGEINQNGMLRLKLVKEMPLGTPSIGASIFSFAMPLKTKIQLNLNQEVAMNGDEILFKVSTASNMPFLSSNGKSESVAFIKR